MRWPSRWVVFSLASALLSACTCEPDAGTETVSAEPNPGETVEGSSEEGSAAVVEEPPVLEEVAVIELGGRGISLVPGPGVVGVSMVGGMLEAYDSSGASSTESVWALDIEAELVAASWLQGTLYAVDGNGGMLVRSRPETGETARLALGGAGSDLWIDTERSWVWVLARGEAESNLIAIEATPDDPEVVGEIRARIPVGTAPVNIVPSADGAYIAVPGFRDREVYIIDAEERRLDRAVSVSFRPARAEFDPLGRVVVTSANLVNAVVIAADGRVPELTVELPGSVSLLERNGDRLVAYSPARSRIWSWNDIEGLPKESEEVGIITSMADGDGWLVAAQADPRGELIVLDDTSLELLGSVELDGLPSDVRVVDDRVWVLLPTRQQIVVYARPD